MQVVFLLCIGVGLGWLGLGALSGAVRGHSASGAGGHAGHGGAAAALHGGAPGQAASAAGHSAGHHAGPARPAAGGGHRMSGLASPTVIAGALVLAGAVGEFVLLVSPLAVLTALAGAALGLVAGAVATLALLGRLLEAQTPDMLETDYVGWSGPLLQAARGAEISEMMATAPSGEPTRCLRVRSRGGVDIVRGTTVVVLEDRGGGVFEVVSEKELLER